MFVVNNSKFDVDCRAFTEKVIIRYLKFNELDDQERSCIHSNSADQIVLVSESFKTYFGPFNQLVELFSIIKQANEQLIYLKLMIS